MTLFAAVELAPRDPILGLNEQFVADARTTKVNLGVGVYFDDAGKLPLLACVRAAEQSLNDAAKPRGYLPIDGIAPTTRPCSGWCLAQTALCWLLAAWPRCRPSAALAG